MWKTDREAGSRVRDLDAHGGGVGDDFHLATMKLGDGPLQISGQPGLAHNLRETRIRNVPVSQRLAE